MENKNTDTDDIVRTQGPDNASPAAASDTAKPVSADGDKFRIDKKKLIIYHEIMTPKF